MENSKNIIVISGPSGSGKSTLIRELFEKFDNLTFSVSYTTRKIRNGEQEGINYNYVSEETFKNMIDNDKFVEWASVYGKYYGTAWEEIKKKSEKDNILILDIDIQGAKKIKEKFNEALMVLISPPSFSELKKRLVNREKRNDEDIRNRLAISLSELKEYQIYDNIIINDDLEKAKLTLNSIVRAYKSRTKFIYKKLAKITDNWN